VYNRTASKADELVELGAVFKTPQEIAKDVDILFLMLGFPHDVEAMCLGQDGILSHMKSGSFLIDHTTSSPGLAIKIAEEAKKTGI
jgi:3-hydroxyisobutyrate dehydrogenase